MVHVNEQTHASIEKAQAEEIAVDESHQGTQKDVYNTEAYRTLIHARRSRPWLAWGAFEDIVVDDERHVYAYRRTSTGPLAPDGARYDVMYVALNTGTFPSEVCLGEEAAPLVDLLSGTPATSRITLDPAGAAVLVPA